METVEEKERLTDDAQQLPEEETGRFYRSQQEVDRAFKKRLEAEKKKWVREYLGPEEEEPQQSTTGEELPDAAAEEQDLEGMPLEAEEEAAFLENMAGAGRLLPLDDHLMDAGSAVAGCGPAFVDLFIEAMADGGVACGLTRPMALECAAQTLIGAARLMLETGRHPGALKDAVCSPGGATIQGVRALEAGGFRSAVMEAVIAAYEKSAEMK